jgi:hypothetical protein
LEFVEDEQHPASALQLLASAAQQEAPALQQSEAQHELPTLQHVSP